MSVTKIQGHSTVIIFYLYFFGFQPHFNKLSHLQPTFKISLWVKPSHVAGDACWKTLWRFSPINHGANAECGSLFNKLCVTQCSYASLLSNLHRLSAGCCVQFRMLFLTSVTLNHSHMEGRASSVNSCFSLGRWSESLINCAMGAESNKWASIPLTQNGICANVGHRASLCLPMYYSTTT